MRNLGLIVSLLVLSLTCFVCSRQVRTSATPASHEFDVSLASDSCRYICLAKGEFRIKYHYVAVYISEISILKASLQPTDTFDVFISGISCWIVDERPGLPASNEDQRSVVLDQTFTEEPAVVYGVPPISVPYGADADLSRCHLAFRISLSLHSPEATCTVRGSSYSDLLHPRNSPPQTMRMPIDAKSHSR
jgi:hypothetical protein